MARFDEASSAQLLTSLQNRDVAAAQSILQSSAILNVNLQDESGRTALHLASSIEGGAACSLILAIAGRGAQLDVPNAHGTTALQKAVLGGHTDAAITLVRCGANPEAPNPKTGLSAFAIARTDALVEGMRAAAQRDKGAKRGTPSIAPAVGTLPDSHNASDDAGARSVGKQPTAPASKEDRLRRLWLEQQRSVTTRRERATPGVETPGVSRQVSPATTMRQFVAGAVANETQEGAGGGRVESVTPGGSRLHGFNLHDNGDDAGGTGGDERADGGAAGAAGGDGGGGGAAGGDGGDGGGGGAASLVRRQQLKRATAGKERLAQRPGGNLAAVASRTSGHALSSSASASGVGERAEPLPAWMREWERQSSREASRNSTFGREASRNLSRETSRTSTTPPSHLASRASRGRASDGDGDITAALTEAAENVKGLMFSLK